MSQKDSKSEHPDFDEANLMLGQVKGLMNMQTFALVVKGDALRGMGDNLYCDLVRSLLPEYQNIEINALLINITNRFETLIRNGCSTTKALEQIQQEKLVEQYEKLVSPKEEIH